MRNIVAVVLICLLFSTHISLAQTVQWRGEERDGHFRKESGLSKSWPQEGPRLILKVDQLGKGFSSPIVTGDAIYVSGMKDTLDYLTALDHEGNIKWQVTYGRSWVKSYPDTRSSPTIDDDRIYVLAGTGVLSCLNSADGKTIWTVKVDEVYESEWHSWGVSESPLIYENKVIVSPGGAKTSVVALDKMTGKEVWRSESVGGPRCYISPAVYDYNGFKYILAATGTHLLALHPDDGKVAWSYKYFNPEVWKQSGLIWANTPLWYKDEIFISMGYNYKAVMLKMNSDGTSVTEKYTSDVLDNHHGGLVLKDGFVYGSNWINNGKGNWVCMDWDSGEIKWETEWENKGSIVTSDGLLYIYDEKRGNVALLKPNPEKFNLLGSFKVNEGTGPHWSHPFIQGRKLYIRHGEVLMVYDISQ